MLSPTRIARHIWRFTPVHVARIDGSRTSPPCLRVNYINYFGQLHQSPATHDLWHVTCCVFWVGLGQQVQGAFATFMKSWYNRFFAGKDRRNIQDAGVDQVRLTSVQGLPYRGAAMLPPPT
jgi:hypothetical protein